VALSLGVAGATYFMKPPENLPIEDLLKSRTGAMLLISMAVWVRLWWRRLLFADTFIRSSFKLHRARNISAMTLQRSPNRLNHAILLTHALWIAAWCTAGWTWGLVAVLVAVGIIFTFVRARTVQSWPAFASSWV